MGRRWCVICWFGRVTFAVSLHLIPCSLCDTEKALLALLAHLIDKDFNLHEVLIFAQPFSEVAHSAAEIEKAIKKGLSSFGIGKYDMSVTRTVDTVSLHI